MPFPEGFGKKRPDSPPKPSLDSSPRPSPNPNLTAALRASLESLETESESKSESNEGFAGTDSPLEQVSTDAVDILLERINLHLTEGMPEKITDDLLRKTIDIFRAQALYWEQEEQKPKERQKRASTKPPIEKLILEF